MYVCKVLIEDQLKETVPSLDRGSVMSDSGNVEEVNYRTSRGRQAFAKQQRIWKMRDVGLSLKAPVCMPGSCKM